jgi:hypothetical protein
MKWKQIFIENKLINNRSKRNVCCQQYCRVQYPFTLGNILSLLLIPFKLAMPSLTAGNFVVQDTTDISDTCLLLPAYKTDLQNSRPVIPTPTPYVISVITTVKFFTLPENTQIKHHCEVSTS